MPPLAKASRPITKVNGALQKENVKILKQAKHTLRSEIAGLTVVGPSESINQHLVGRRNGPVENHPSDLPDPNKTVEKPLESPSADPIHKNLGEYGVEEATAIEETQTEDDAMGADKITAGVAKGDTAMEEAMATSCDVEVVRTTQF